ncbi:hypothetical protein AVKW3434_21795 [Acidovorax sp. SUPP3434]|uniref:NTF2 fold immunity protein n=1 Tax=Acidovorax sp. SUPP3434 TaxID=2920880 RepID=UPI0023DE67EA|nr:NTF2 fold immunity protein [Acidovorax sp. SUPP3434]GKT02070.1 hypothetical protein AVKW3434_21795 [Acidovorax sp. SUPP3434]
MNPKETIENYLKEMLNWEKRRYSKTRDSSYKGGDFEFKKTADQEARNELKTIINKFLTSNAKQTLGQSTEITMAVGNPPIYDQSITSVEEEKNEAKIICDSNNGALLGASLKYTLIMENGAWKINSLHSSRDKKNWRKNNGL